MGEKRVKENNDVLLDYLHQISIALTPLTFGTDGGKSTAFILKKQNCDLYLNQITRNLLDACSPNTVGLPVPRQLLDSLEKEHTTTKLEDNDDDEEGHYKDETSLEIYRKRFSHRSDFIRCVLRAMAPIAMDIGARVSFLVVDLLSEGKDETTASAFVLFSTWLPIAPQLTPFVSDLFALENFICPFDCCNNDNSNKVDGGAPLARKKLILAAAANGICQFYGNREEHDTLSRWWNWGPLFGMLYSVNSSDNDVVMEDIEAGDNGTLQKELDKSSDEFNIFEASKWHSARAIGYLMSLSPAAFAEYLEQLSVRNCMVPWMLHPWIIEQEEENSQLKQIRGVTSLWNSAEEVGIPSLTEVRLRIPVHPSLVHVGDGVLLARRNPVTKVPSAAKASVDYSNQSSRSTVGPELVMHPQQKRKNLILTPTTARNLSLLGTALCTDPYPPPILICGPNGSGKSSLVRELAHYCASSSSSMQGSPHSSASHTHQDELLELHVDEETDSKTLIGSYATTDVPGEFTWRPGALTRAVRMGKWVLMEDVDTVPLEIQAAIVKLLEERLLPLGGGKVERCHPNFRLFGTCTTATETYSNDDHATQGRLRSAVSNAGRGGKKILHPALWRKVHVEPLPFSELIQVTRALYPSLPTSILDAAIEIFRSLDNSGRADSATPIKSKKIENSHSNVSPIEVVESDSKALSSIKWSREAKRSMGGRYASVRDFMKLLARLSSTLQFEKNTSYATEAQRTLCLAESVDIFVASCPSREHKQEFVSSIAAPAWGITADLAIRYVETRRPSISVGSNCVEVGRARVTNLSSHGRHVDEPNQKFAQTNYALRLMESAGVCISQNEPVLFVGETGVGKTTVIQQLAALSRQDLVVQNLSLQTDSTDLLGGYRPLEMKHIARRVYLEFVDLFVSTFSRKQNLQFLKYASSTHEKGQWKRLSQCFRKAAKLGLQKVRERRSSNGEEENDEMVTSMLDMWTSFHAAAERYERQRLACESGLAFAFTEGALVDAIRNGKWILLDEINLASSETLQRLCGLLDDSHGSVTLTERGDSEALKRHPDFRLFAAMNPATDAGKKDLPASIRSRFTEVYVDELVDPVELRTVSVRYLSGVIAAGEKPPEHTETIISAVEVYLQCRDLAEQVLVDGSGQKPRYTMRTLCRALTAARNLIIEQRLSLSRSILEGFELAFEGPLDKTSTKTVRRTLRASLGKGLSKNELDHPPRRPGTGNFVLVKPFWIKAGPKEPEDWAESSSSGRSKFILTPSASLHLRTISRAVAAGPWPVLLEGPTSAGKTTLVEYLAARCGHQCVRINNHEHTDVQEYTGTYAADSNGSLSFHDGILVRALKLGHWVILDELNLAPSEVLEALNRLLDDNRELYLAEINETVKPHPNFRLFATQNPSGAYGGRKPLSRAFRNRFVEIHLPDIPSDEMTTILELRCKCPPSHAKALVKVMTALRQRRSKSGVFLGKDGLITPRDLLRWAERRVTTKIDLAHEGYILLAERLRTEEEKDIVREEIESQLKVSLDCESLYYGKLSEARIMLEKASRDIDSFSEDARLLIRSVAPTKSLLRLLSLVVRCIRQKEPVLLVGDTGCGKTTVVQLLSFIIPRHLHIINCHATTETGDILGGLRPVRGRNAIGKEIFQKTQRLLRIWPKEWSYDETSVPSYLLKESETHLIRDTDLPEDAVLTMHSFTQSLWESRPRYGSAEGSPDSDESSKKRRKLSSGVKFCTDSSSEPEMACSNKEEDLNALVAEIESLFRKHVSLFEWADGPLVRSMKEGHMLLLDEMSLAEDAVLERLNSVLEPSRSLVLAEKGDDGSSAGNMDNHVIRAHADFRIFATMNPGGDFGKRELSPALRSRFTEIWVPAVTDASDVDLVLERTLASRAVQAQIEKKSLEDLVMIRKNMLKYVNWFNFSVCNDTASACADLALSLRDILAWARFIIDAFGCNEEMSLWNSYSHGACLMHLDGLGLGTGLSREDADVTKKRAMSYLADQIPVDHRINSMDGIKQDSDCDSHHYIFTDTTFGMHPFTISRGPEPIPTSNFNLKAPTTGSNLLRVLRAMQLSKPVLLEGSPGVGKTSLISALASASGHRLVRINLSEQTDISDLMGSDLPIPDQEPQNSDISNDKSSNKTGSSSFASSFKWCDGVLLKAIKRGDWVLLDELNLASQSVLEGLNSCLDHRANVFIPELGKTFDCPPSFRVFAAQNPLAQGGGRKGLPKSFLNRFTKVYIEALTRDDLQAIVSSRFPSIPISFVNSMIAFNSMVHQDVVEHREFGDLGSPWEFNLRDVFRWCELIVFANCNESLELAGRFACDIYLHRFRSMDDRRELQRRYQECFGHDMLWNKEDSVLRVTDTQVQIGNAILERKCGSVGRITNEYNGQEPAILRSLLFPMETAARCIQMDWPCLLVGPSPSGKTELLKGMAELCNANMVEVSLTPSSDVNELVGCFEQVDSVQNEKDILNAVNLFYQGACSYLVGNTNYLKLLHEISEACFTLKNSIAHSDSAAPGTSIFEKDSTLLSTTQKLAKLFTKATRLNSSFNCSYSLQIADMCKKVDLIEANLNSKGGRKDESHFRWVDGILVTAMINGDWLHLENVNFCPSSVLDRLNPLMEKGGELLLTECSIDEDSEAGLESGHRVVKPHPDFKIFLSMNPTFGEVSRAMRNRCVEISLLPISQDEMSIAEVDDTTATTTKLLSSPAVVDSLDAMWRTGIRSSELATRMLRLHCLECVQAGLTASEPPSPRNLMNWGLLSTSLMKRGFDIGSAVSKPLQLSYELDTQATAMIAKDLPPFHSDLLLPCALMSSPSIRSDWGFDPMLAKVKFEARIVKLVADCKESSDPNFELMFPGGLSELRATDATRSLNSSYEELCGMLPKGAEINLSSCKHLVALYLRKFSLADKDTRIGLLQGSGGTFSSFLDLMSSIFQDNQMKPLEDFLRKDNRADTCLPEQMLVDPLDCPVPDTGELDTTAICMEYHRVESFVNRLVQLSDEKHTYQKLSLTDLSARNLSAIEASYCLHEETTDRGSISCPITPALYPLFQSVDAWIHALEHDTAEGIEISHSLSKALTKFVAHRDRLWIYLNESPMTREGSSSFLAFDETGFVVHWLWLKKALEKAIPEYLKFRSYLAETKQQQLRNLKRKMDFHMNSIECTLFDNVGNTSSLSLKTWKHGGHPLVPAKASHWNAIQLLRNCATSYSLFPENKFGLVSMVSEANEVIELSDLARDYHPSLFIGIEEKLELLAALCMAHWSTTDEMRGETRPDTLSYDCIEAQSVLRTKLENTRAEFVAKVNAMKIDTQIKTVENEMDIERLEKLKSESFKLEIAGREDDIKESLLERFALIQTSQFAEFWCVHEECRIIGQLSKLIVLSSGSDSLQENICSLLPYLKNFIDVVLRQTFWAMADVRPYQTLLWACDGLHSGERLEYLLRCIVPQMMFFASQHVWCNSFNDLEVVSDRLVCPSLWNSESETTSRKQGSRASSASFVASSAGPTRLEQPVRSEAMFRLVGSEFSDLYDGYKMFSFVSLENYQTRLLQSQNLFYQFSELALESSNELELFELQYLFTNSMEALIGSFDEECKPAILSFIKTPGSLWSLSHGKVQKLFSKCRHPAYIKILDSVVLPLIGTLYRLHNSDIAVNDIAEEISLAWIYIGLIRIQLYTPGSPLDPGKKPIAKVLEQERYLRGLSGKLTAVRMDSGYLTGNFFPNSEYEMHLLEEAKVTRKKLSKQEKKRVERVAGAPPYYELFRESRNFVKSVGATDGVLDLVKHMRDARLHPERLKKVISRELNWQSTAGSFCARLSSHFAPYEDVIIPLSNAVRNIQRGLRELAGVCLSERQPNDAENINLLDHLLAYPMGSLGNTSHSIKHVTLLKGENSASTEDADPDEIRSHVTTLLASLCRLEIHKCARSGKVGKRFYSTCLALLEAVTKGCLVALDSPEEIIETEEEMQERMYRDQFPDHSKEFNELIYKVENSDEIGYEESEEIAEIHDFDAKLSESQLALLAEVHEDLFAMDRLGVNDASRVRAFRVAYSAACLIGTSSRWDASTPATLDRPGAHIMALSLCANWKGGGALKYCSIPSNGSYSVDFHKDPNPEEVVLGALPLSKLIIRISQLLTAFPGHSILTALGQVAESVRKLDIAEVSVGKVMTGLEVILRKAQEWEQFASDRVKLGSPLVEISGLVARWRKMELQSWSTLLDNREERHANQARKHWPRLYSLLCNKRSNLPPSSFPKHLSASSSFNSDNRYSGDCPSWVWKGCSQEMKRVTSSTLDDADIKEIAEVSRVLDGFLLTSVLGEFRQRLNLIKNFSLHLLKGCISSDECDIQQLSLARVLSSLCSHYSQFIDTLALKKEELRRPIEKKLKDEVKLAKWDEQSYYALAESSEKNHRKLMKILREYDEVLDLSVGKLLEDQFCYGIRSSKDSIDGNSEPCTSIPPNTMIFPSVNANEQEEPRNKITIKPGATEDKLKTHIWTDLTMFDIQYDDHVRRMRRYFKKICSIRSEDHANHWGVDGSIIASDLCSTIFDRIGLLRGEKTTKPMKQRALVDLFKELKRNGYSTTKWSVPKQIREMVHILMLPKPTRKEQGISTENHKTLSSAEVYFQKTVTELNRLRSEISTFGSQHMSQREMQLMQSFSEHGLMMLCQQRCALASILPDVDHLQSLLNSSSALQQSLPIRQVSLQNLVRNFDDAFCSAVENLQQLLLLMRNSSPLANDNKKKQLLHDIITTVDSHISCLQKSYKLFNDFSLYSHESLQNLANARHLLENTHQQVSDCRLKCKSLGCLPSDVFDICLVEINKACKAASTCDERSNLASPTTTKVLDISHVLGAISCTVKSILVSVQGMVNTAAQQSGDTITSKQESNSNDENGAEKDHDSLWQCHSSALKEWSSINLKQLNHLLGTTIDQLRLLHEFDEIPEAERAFCVQVTSDLCILMLQVADMIKEKLSDYTSLFRNSAKLNYVLIRIFRSLVAKGFCADNVADGGEGDGEGDVSGMNFDDDNDGTGMGEGDGQKDVTDQLESEEQLLGLKGDDENDQGESAPEQKQLDKEEAEQGMEMEGDFEGDMFDVPDADEEDDDKKEDEDGEEELDRDMGDGTDPNEEIVDEKMWGDSDDEDEINKGEEKFEQDSGMKGEALEDELRTKEEEENKDTKDDSAAEPSKQSDSNQEPETEPPKEEGGADNEMEGDINEDLEDNYEEKPAGVDVRNDEQENEGDQEPDNDDDMELGEDLNLDDMEEGGTDADNMDVDDEAPPEEQDDEDGKEDTGLATEEDKGENDNAEDEGEEDEAIQTSAQHGGDTEMQDDNDDEEPGADDNDAEEKQNTDVSAQEPTSEETHGVAGKDGSDRVKEHETDDATEDENDGQGDDDAAGDGADAPPEDPSGSGGGESGDGQRNTFSDGNDGEGAMQMSINAPNPFRDPGDATEFWHKKLNMIEETQDAPETQESGDTENKDDQKDGKGEFEFTSSNQESTTQVLGGTTEEEALQIENKEEEVDQSVDPEGDEVPPNEDQPKSENEDSKERSSSRTAQKPSGLDKKEDPKEDMDTDADDAEHEIDTANSNKEETPVSESDDNGEGDDVDEKPKPDNRVVSDLSQLRLRDGDVESMAKISGDDLIEEEQIMGINTAEAAEARARWAEIQSETHNLSRRLCEKLRLVMEPLVATKLRGDYRTGKRINMKRVIGYIASGYRKDKIWLRRTKPAKRDYRVLLAVDDSESMQKSGAGDMALAALSTLATGMSQLEIGELGVASFGEEMRLLHPFHQPFTSESGVNLVRNFTFDEKRTRTALCVESALSALESQGEHSSMQLVFMISDGRIERDSRAELRRLIREMSERNILLVMIIVEGKKGGRTKKKDSIVHMKEVTFEKGKPKVKQFIDDYPFPYYMVLDDMKTLPEVLGDALRQWFEMLAQLNSTTS